MMDKSFHERRRQQFLTAPFYAAALDYYAEGLRRFAQKLGEDDSDLEDRSLLASSVADFQFARLTLNYTAGEPIEPLRAQLEQVIEAYERYQKARAAYEDIPNISPLGLGLPDEYERLMQILGLAVLLHRPDLILRMAALIDPRYKGEDTLYEDLLAYYMDGRVDIDEWFHPKPYSPLIQAMYEADEKEASAKLDAYCKGWYAAFKHAAPWHDSHLRIEGTDGDYFGYWAFEAGAVAYLCNIDDSAITHMVYPKDLVVWARENKQLSEAMALASTAWRRCEAGQPCPKEGWWFTPAKADSRRHFKAGELMPDLKADYGATIWQWGGNQD